MGVPAGHVVEQRGCRERLDRVLLHGGGGVLRAVRHRVVEEVDGFVVCSHGSVVGADLKDFLQGNSHVGDGVREGGFIVLEPCELYPAQEVETVERDVLFKKLHGLGLPALAAQDVGLHELGDRAPAAELYGLVYGLESLRDSALLQVHLGEIEIGCGLESGIPGGFPVVGFGLLELAELFGNHSEIVEHLAVLGIGVVDYAGLVDFGHVVESGESHVGVLEMLLGLLPFCLAGVVDAEIDVHA